MNAALAPSSPPTKCLSLHLKNSHLTFLPCSKASLGPLGKHPDLPPDCHFVWGLPQVAPDPVPLPQPASGTLPSIVADTLLEPYLSAFAPFLIWPHSWAPWALEEGPGISAPRRMGRTLFPVLPWHGVSQVRGAFPNGSQAGGLLLVLLGGSNPCVPVLGVYPHMPMGVVPDLCPPTLRCLSGGVVRGFAGRG